MCIFLSTKKMLNKESLKQSGWVRSGKKESYKKMSRDEIISMKLLIHEGKQRRRKEVFNKANQDYFIKEMKRVSCLLNYYPIYFPSFSSPSSVIKLILTSVVPSTRTPFHIYGCLNMKKLWKFQLQNVFLLRRRLSAGCSGVQSTEYNYEALDNSLLWTRQACDSWHRNERNIFTHFRAWFTSWCRFARRTAFIKIYGQRKPWSVELAFCGKKYSRVVS